MIIQLNPTLPVITPKGKATAHFLIEHGDEHHLQFVCFQDDTGECWTWQNPDVRLQGNVTMGRAVVHRGCDKCNDAHKVANQAFGSDVIKFYCEKCGRWLMTKPDESPY